jgi:hypothetical protein
VLEYFGFGFGFEEVLEEVLNVRCPLPLRGSGQGYGSASPCGAAANAVSFNDINEVVFRSIEPRPVELVFEIKSGPIERVFVLSSGARMIDFEFSYRAIIEYGERNRPDDSFDYYEVAWSGSVHPQSWGAKVKAMRILST